MANRMKQVVVAVAAAATLVLTSVAVAGASEPSQHNVTLTSQLGTQVYEWTGEVPPGVQAYKGTATNPCVNNPEIEDVHTIEIRLGHARVYKEVNISFAFTANWQPSGVTSDLEMEIYGPSGTPIGESTNSDPSESFKTTNLDEGTYQVVLCGASNELPQEYQAKLELITTSKSRKPRAGTTETPPADGSAGENTGNTGGGSRPSSGGGGGTSRPDQPGFSQPFTPGAGVGRISDPLPIAAPPEAVSATPAAPSAFLGGPIAVAPEEPPPLTVTNTEDIPQVPLGIALVVSALGLAGGAFALTLRRRRGLDQVPGTAVVPVG